MNKIPLYYWVLMVLFSVLSINPILAQGPPITSDKPIMLGSKRTVIKTLSEVRRTQAGSVINTPLMAHYLPTSNTLLGLHIPLVNHQPVSSNNNFSLGDIQILGKYQFYRKDNTGKTFRMVAKMLHTLPSGKKINADGISNGYYQAYTAIVAGYESIKYGISNELGINFIPQNKRHEWRYKLGFGLPLLKPSYPVKQLNLYFEYQNRWFFQQNEYQFLYAQGMQYAKGRMTFETAFQWPLLQKMPLQQTIQYSWFLGFRYVI